jgi:hypothetical protein
VDEKYQIQCAGRTVPVLPMQPGLILASQPSNSFEFAPGAV